MDGFESDGTADGAYMDRSLLAQLCAAMARQLGWACWVDATDSGWPILFIDTPAGQVSYHIALSDLTNFMAELPRRGPDAWDGHDLAEKQNRVRRAIDALAQPVKVMSGEEFLAELEAEDKRLKDEGR